MKDFKKKVKRIISHIADIKTHYKTLLPGAKKTLEEVKLVPKSRDYTYAVQKDVIVYEEILKTLKEIEAKAETLNELLKLDKIPAADIEEAIEKGKIDPEKIDHLPNFKKKGEDGKFLCGDCGHVHGKER